MARLLIGYDGSDESRRAIRIAAGLFPGAEAVVLYVAEPPMPNIALGVAGVPLAGPAVPPPPGDLVSDEFTEQLEQHARDAAEEGAREATAAGLQASADTAWGHGSSGVAQAICDASDNHDVDAIVVGTRGRSGLRAALLGSVSGAVAHQAHRPVVVTPHGA